MNHKDRFIELLLKAGALRFGSFKTKSGRMSPYFFNTGLLNTGETLSEAAAIYAAALKDAFGERCDNLYGPAYKGISLAVATALELHRLYGRSITYTFNRKEAKDHGEGGNLVGWAYTGKEQVVIVEDVLTAGTSVRESLALLASYKIKPVGILLGIDRQERGTGAKLASAEIAADYGVPVTAIVTLEEIIARLYNRECLGKIWIDDAMMATIRTYRTAHA